MKQWTRTVMVSVLGLAVLTGCNRGGCGRKPQGEVPETAMIDQLRIEIADLKIEQGRDAAIVRMKGMIQDPALAEYKASLTEWLLDEYLREESVEATQDAYLALAAMDDEFARLGFRKIMDASTATDAEATAAWYDKILAAPVSDAMKAYVWQRRAEAYAESGSIAPCVARLDEILALGSPEQNLAIVGSVAGAGLKISDYAGLDALLAAVRDRGAERQDLLQRMLVLEADMLLQQDKLAEAETFLNANADALGDGSLKTAVLRLLAKADATMAARLVAAAYAAGDTRPVTRDAVASSWIRMASTAQQREAFLARAGEALDSGCPPPRVVSVFKDGFYMVMTSRDAALQTRCTALARRLNDSLPEEDRARQTLSLMLLDGAFYVQDFKQALAVIEGGVHGYDEQWHAEMTDKVGAHLALQENRPEDAVALFRKHMERVLAWTAPVMNPENGAKMIKEAVMGFNEKRIGDIYAGMEGRGEDAQAAYGRARNWYQKALELLEPDSLEHKQATAELAAVPAAPQS